MDGWRFSSDGVEAFRARTEGFLVAREAENNLVFGILAAIAIGRYRDYVLGLRETAGTVDGVCLMTRPHNLILSTMDDDVAASLADALQAAEIDVPGVNGSEHTAAAFARAWCAGSGGSAEHELGTSVYRLIELVPPPPSPGAWRAARDDDRELLHRWIGDFVRDGFAREPAANEVERATERITANDASGGGGFWVDGDEVSLAGYSGPTPNGIRIGPVYTPPERRGRGYAAAAVAALCADLLAGGRRYVFLFADRTNPTANGLYRRLGFNEVTRFDEYRFTAR